MAAVAPLSKKYGKRNVALAGSLINLLGQLIMFASPASATWLIVCSLIKGIGNAALVGTIFAMIADTIEYGQWKTGKRVEGMLYSSTTFGAKIGAGIGGAAALGIIGAAGYDGLAAVQIESAIILIPVFYIFYKLDKIYPTVISELQEQEKESSN